LTAVDPAVRPGSMIAVRNEIKAILDSK